MFEQLNEINKKPKPFEFYTADHLWTDEHTSKKMLEFHLNDDIDLSSRNKGFINKSVDWIVERFGVGKGTAIADFGCGPGLYTTALAGYGADVTGIDFSRRSIQYARGLAEQKGLGISYRKVDYLDLETDKRFDLIIMIFCDFCALSHEQRKTLLGKFYKFLKPGGRVLLDVHTVNTYYNREAIAVYEKNQLDGFWSPDDYYGFLNTFKYDQQKVTLDKYTIIEEGRTRVVYNWLQYFTKESLLSEFKDVGFKVDAFYSDVAGTAFDPVSPDMAIVAER